MDDAATINIVDPRTGEFTGSTILADGHPTNLGKEIYDFYQKNKKTSLYNAIQSYPLILQISNDYTRNDKYPQEIVQIEGVGALTAPPLDLLYAPERIRPQGFLSAGNAIEDHVFLQEWNYLIKANKTMLIYMWNNYLGTVNLEDEVLPRFWHVMEKKAYTTAW